MAKQLLFLAVFIFVGITHAMAGDQDEAWDSRLDTYPRIPWAATKISKLQEISRKKDERIAELEKEQARLEKQQQELERENKALKEQNAQKECLASDTLTKLIVLK